MVGSKESSQSISRDIADILLESGLMKGLVLDNKTKLYWMRGAVARAGATDTESRGFKTTCARHFQKSSLCSPGREWVLRSLQHWGT